MIKEMDCYYEYIRDQLGQREIMVFKVYLVNVDLLVEQDLVDQLEVVVILDLKVHKEKKEQQEIQELEELQDLRVLQVHLDMMVLQVQSGYLGQLDLEVQLELKEKEDHKVFVACKDLKD